MNQHQTMLRSTPLPLANPNSLGIPLHRLPMQLRQHPGQHRVGTGISEQNQMMLRDHLLCQFLISNHPDIPPKPFCELLTEVLQHCL